MGFVIYLLVVVIIIIVASQRPKNSQGNGVSIFDQVKQLQSRVAVLEHEVRKLRSSAEHIPTSPEAHAETPHEEEVIKLKEEISKEAVPREITPAVAHRREFPLEQAVSNEKPKEIKQKVDFESLFTGNIINKIGVLALILGMGFFLNYTFTQSWVSPIVKIMISAFTAIGFLSGAAWFNKKETYKIFVQGIAGAGIAILYLTIFAASNYYHLLSYPVAFVLTSITALIAFSQALKYNSIATAIFGIVGGFITPFLMSSNVASSAELLTYFVFLNIWIIALAYKKTDWKAVEILGLFATYVSYFTLQSGIYPTGNWLVLVCFLALIWALYFCLDVSKIARKIKTFNFEGNFLNVANGIVFYSGMYVLFNQNNPNLTVVATVVIAMIYLISGIKIYYKYGKLDGYLKQNIYAFVALIAISTNLATTGFVKAIAFAIEARLVLVFGTEYNKSYIWKASPILFVLSYFALLINPQTYSSAMIENFVPLFNLRLLAFAIIIGLSIYCTNTLSKIKHSEGLVSFYRYSWTTLLFVLLSVEISDLMIAISSSGVSQDVDVMIAFNRGMVQIIVWSLYSSRLLSVGVDKNIKPYTYLGFIGTAISVLCLFAQGTYYPAQESYIPLFNLRFVTFALMAMNFMYIANLLKRNQEKYDWCASAQRFFTYAWGIILFLLVTFEIKDCSFAVENTVQLVISGGWLIYAIVAMYSGILRRIKPLRQIALTVLGLAIVKVFIFDLSFLDQLARIISFMGLGVILLMLSFFYQKYGEQIKKIISEE